LETTEEHLRLLGNDPQKPKGVVEVYAPVSGVITGLGHRRRRRDLGKAEGEAMEKASLIYVR
jgi:hypothetical protein